MNETKPSEQAVKCAEILHSWVADEGAITEAEFAEIIDRETNLPTLLKIAETAKKYLSPDKGDAHFHLKKLRALLHEVKG
jgi:hypothetical protein